MKIQNVKGGYDFLPKEQKVRNYINDTLRKVFEEYGYNSIETPILCYYDILSDKYDENSDILKEIYKLSDQGDRQLGLRYDLTVPFAKFIAINKNDVRLPFKRYEINKVFRDGPVKVGRDREFTQCDVDVVGITGQLIEAELLSLYKKGFDLLGIDIYIKYNSRNLMNGLIKEAGISSDLISAVTTIIDKMDKISNEEFCDYLSEIGLEAKEIENLNLFFDLSLRELNKKFKKTNNQDIIVGLNEINKLNEYIEKLGFNNICVFSPTLARGQNYYTGNVFEVYDKERRVGGSIGGGGRYDNMIGNFIDDGNNYPAVGISFGLSSIYEILKNNSEFNDKANLDFYIIPMGVEIEGLEIANKLRNIGFNVDIEMQGRTLRKSLDYANKENISYVIIIGENEINSGKVVIKDMVNSKNIEIEISNIENIKDILK